MCTTTRIKFKQQFYLISNIKFINMTKLLSIFSFIEHRKFLMYSEILAWRFLCELKANKKRSMENLQSVGVEAAES